tara:strand:+ start:889 stop:2454 length:1566 start_codon:yes stop_codon:yes gene_type:complete
MQAMGQTLNAFYDLEVCPITFDFVNFLILAELERRRRKLKDLHVTIVPGSNEGFRDDDAAFNTSNKIWRLEQVAVPACWLMPKPVKLTICRKRSDLSQHFNELSENIFPLDYHPDAPRGDFLWAGIAAAAATGEDIPRLRATAQGKTYMAQWLSSLGKETRPVTITLRESSHKPARNSNIVEWAEAAKKISGLGFHPIIVRDTENSFNTPDPLFKNFSHCPQAAVNLDLRLALYELCQTNLMVLNGPGVLCWLSKKASYIMFRMITSNVDNSNLAMLASMGLAPNSDLAIASPKQRLIWETDTSENIVREFQKLTKAMNNDDDNDLIQSPKVDSSLTLAQQFFLTGRFEEATSIVKKYLESYPEHPDAWQLIGLIAFKAEKFDVAEKMMQRAINLDGTKASFFVNLGTLYRRTSRHEEALQAFTKVILIDDNDADAHAQIAELLLLKGEKSQAKGAMGKAVEIGQHSPEICEKAAKMLNDLGNYEDANGFYRRAIELREELEKERQIQKAKSPELVIPSIK